MAEYWKSLPRKFCDACKCWFADNKASIDFHERGKRHKENAAKRIQEIQKKGIKDFKKQKKLEDEMAKIEKAALAAYQKDLQNIEGAGNVSKVEPSVVPKKSNIAPNFYLSEKLQTNTKCKKTGNIVAIKKESPEQEPDNTKSQKTVNIMAIKKESPEQEPDNTESQKTVNIIAIKKELPEQEPEASRKWYEGVTEEGDKYYWNAETSESQWEPPEESYISLEEQNQANTGTESIETVKEEEESEKSDENSNSETSCIVGPQPKVDPYGAWTEVKKIEPVEIDYQLPEFTKRTVEVIPLHQEENVLKFKEKIVGSIADSDSGVVTFKKRKFAGCLKKNVRKRTEDD